MSTKIQHESGTPLEISTSSLLGRPDEVLIRIGESSAPGYFHKRADFLAAVATECNVRIVPADAIVIERGELPEVDLTWDKRAVMVNGIEYPIGASSSAEEYREIAGRALALAAYLDANPPKPPVDSAMVDALTLVLDEQTAGSDLFADGSAGEFALRLYLAGVRIEAAK